MEKPQPLPLRRLSIQVERPKSAVWDCGSTLYDSFELKSFNQHLDSAISSARTLSMPHLPDRRVVAEPRGGPPAGAEAPNKKPSKISRSIHRLVRSIFRWKRGSSMRPHPDHGFYVLYDKSGALTTIAEAPEIDHLATLSPDANPLVRRVVSERFTSAPVSISYA
ncbi:hypothetical protein SAY87_015265 [Trapa incisa]|uniref:Uncharacterized protein n=1 Tax=Trapa incisa TaxID=236973 RepID=A0AAN7H0V4_9MYRT|nr:hypothetical protein SAY87_015265 [Trapa incisa]